MPVVQLAVHAKSSTLYGRSYGRTVVRSYGRISNFFLLDGLLLFCIIMGLRSASSAIIKLVQIGIYAYVLKITLKLLRRLFYLCIYHLS